MFYALMCPRRYVNYNVMCRVMAFTAFKKRINCDMPQISAFGCMSQIRCSTSAFPFGWILTGWAILRLSSTRTITIIATLRLEFVRKNIKYLTTNKTFALYLSTFPIIILFPNIQSEMCCTILAICFICMCLSIEGILFSYARFCTTWPTTIFPISIFNVVSRC